MKRLFIISALFGALGAGELDNFLSPTYNELFDAQLKKSLKQKDYNKLSWISPVTLSFQRSWSNQIEGGWHPYNSYSIGIEQAIFKGGGIYYGVKYANSNYSLARATISQQKAKLGASAAELLYKYKATYLSIKKIKLQIENSKIEIKRAKELYDAGLYGSEVLDSSLSKESEANIALMQLKANLEDVRAAYKKITAKEPKLKDLHRVKMPSRDRFLEANTNLLIATLNRDSKRVYAKVVRSKYLPSVSLGARYTKVSNAQPRTKDAFTNYSLKVSMPISVNMGNDLEVAKLDTIVSSIELKQKRHEASIDYDRVVKRVKIIDRKIHFANRDKQAYKRLLKSTKEQYRAGQKSILDLKVLQNSLKMKEIEIELYRIDREIEILKLYESMK